MTAGLLEDQATGRIVPEHLPAVQIDMAAVRRYPAPIERAGPEAALGAVGWLVDQPGREIGGQALEIDQTDAFTQRGLVTPAAQGLAIQPCAPALLRCEAFIPLWIVNQSQNGFPTDKQGERGREIGNPRRKVAGSVQWVQTPEALIRGIEQTRLIRCRELFAEEFILRPAPHERCAQVPLHGDIRLGHDAAVLLATDACLREARQEFLPCCADDDFLQLLEVRMHGYPLLIRWHQLAV
ncbi:hypothetical protein D9M68_337890 [compost metagenome]